MATRIFDYVVVGGGSGGSVVAAKLAEDGRFSVALVEEGRRDTNPWIGIPGTFHKALASQDATVVTSDPDETIENRPFNVPQGRVLGGGSSVNGMIYIRGQARDYDEWEQEHGCDGWGFDQVLSVFKGQEANQRLGDPYHGQSGPLKVGDPNHKHPVTAALIEAGLSAGIPPTNDYNGERQEGCGWYQLTATDGRRNSAARAFLHPVIGKDTLTLLTGHKALRVRFEGRRACGLEAMGPDGEVFIEARKEIVLCAGSFHSPRLLMLSGIGPADNLNRFGIDVVHDAPEVGGNLQDHIGTPVTMRLKDSIGLHGADRGLRALRHGAEYLMFRKGLLSSNILEAGAIVDTDGDGREDVQYNFGPFAPGEPGKPLPFHALQVHPMTMRPKSRSRIHLGSGNPHDAPVIKSRVLEAEEDLDTLRRGVRLAREILLQPNIRDLVAEEVWPGPDVSSSIGSNTLDTAIRKWARTIFHPSGTCRMGGSPSAVTDPRLRVNGVEGLRVADCSIMPAITSGNTNAPTMMIAERCARWMLEDA